MEYDAIQSVDYVKDEHCKTVLSLKSANGTLFIDVRKWFKWNNEDTHHASSKGIMLDLNDWNTIMPMIQKMISENLVDNVNQSTKVEI